MSIEYVYLYLNQQTKTNKMIYIKFLNKEKNFTIDTKEFNNYSEAVSWGQKNIEKFNLDMINYK